MRYGLGIFLGFENFCDFYGWLLLGFYSNLFELNMCLKSMKFCLACLEALMWLHSFLPSWENWELGGFICETEIKLVLALRLARMVE